MSEPTEVRLSRLRVGAYTWETVFGLKVFPFGDFSLLNW